MGQVNSIANLVNVPDLAALKRFLAGTLQSIITQINGNLVFGANIFGAGPYTVNFTSSTSPLQVSHNLGTIPSGIIIIKQSAAGIIYAPPGQTLVWQSDRIFLQSSLAQTATLYVI